MDNIGADRELSRIDSMLKVQAEKGGEFSKAQLAQINRAHRVVERALEPSFFSQPNETIRQRLQHQQLKIKQMKRLPTIGYHPSAVNREGFVDWCDKFHFINKSKLQQKMKGIEKPPSDLIELPTDFDPKKDYTLLDGELIPVKNTRWTQLQPVVRTQVERKKPVVEVIVRSCAPSPGHTYIKVTKTTGDVYVFGFYPDESASEGGMGKGIIEQGDRYMYLPEKIYETHSLQMALKDDATVDELLKYVEAKQKQNLDPDTDSIPFHIFYSNCTHFGKDIIDYCTDTLEAPEPKPATTLAWLDRVLIRFQTFMIKIIALNPISLWFGGINNKVDLGSKCEKSLDETGVNRTFISPLALIESYQ